MNKYPCVGIDLGTTYSALAVINAAGRPEIVPNAEGERATRSAIYFQENGPVLIGEPARRSAGGYPERVIQWVKRRMGDFDWRFQFDGQSYSAIDLSGMILRKVKKDAEARLGDIKYAVVTVPAYFDESRRTATMNAAKLAGLELLEIMNEPTAASITYASTGGRPGTILVYDFGGGTFDVSIVKVKDAFDVEVIATEGDHKLGGKDLDKKLAHHIAQNFHKEKKVLIEEDEKSGDWLDLLYQSEMIKKNLSSTTQDRCRPSWGAHMITMDVNRSTFEDLIPEEILRTQMLVENALTAAEMRPKDIDEVLLVGGSTRIPAVKEMLKKKFGKEPISYVNVDEAVAMGAAIKAGYLMHKEGLTELTPEAAAVISRTRLQDVTAHSLGTFAVLDVGGSNKRVNDIILRKNSPIPAKQTKTYYTMQKGQTLIDCSVTQGEDSDPEFVQLLLNKNMELPAGRPAQCPIEVTYSYDANGVMKFEFKDVESGRVKVLESADAQRAKQHVEEVEANFDDLEIE
ncbi:MAG: Hsp70 family protein [Sedimentisphaerales bacterium]|nr:Hsp70 family protein [Sedimentisphaerales bacterium]